MGSDYLINAVRMMQLKSKICDLSYLEDLFKLLLASLSVFWFQACSILLHITLILRER